MSYPHYFKAALIHQLNIVGVAGFGLLGLVSMNPIPLLVGAALEVAWLMFAPAMPAFRRSVDNKKIVDKRIDLDDRNRKLLRELPAAMQARYDALLRQSDEIRRTQQGYEKVDASFFAALTDRLDEMTMKFASLLSAFDAYDRLLREGGGREVQAKLDALEAEMAGDDEAVREVKQRQADILRKRLDKIAKVRRDRELVKAQIETIEEMVKLFRDQAVSMRSPAEVSGKLDEIMNEFDVRSTTIAELEGLDGDAFDAMLADVERKKLNAQ